MTKAREIAEWIAGLKLSDIPPRIIEKAKYQILSVLGAVFPGSHSSGGRKIFDVLREGGGNGPCTVIPSGISTSPENAVLLHSAYSIAYDFDDYLFMGHPCHSAVTVPLSLCQQMKLGGKEFLLAQIIANEVEGRLGAAVLLGPHNGQTWSFIHAVGSTCAASKLLNLGPGEIENAIGIALYQPNYVLFPGFMGPDTKLLTAGVPASLGLLAARLASTGFTGAGEIIESSQGFLRHFSFFPIERMLTGWGKSWVLDTICFKPYPGCAYIDSTIDALLTIMKEFQAAHRRPLSPEDVGTISVRATMLTAGMDGLSQKWRSENILTPVLMNFSIPLSVAATIVSGQLTTYEMSQDFLDDNKEGILTLAKRVALSLDWDMSLKIMESFMDSEILDIFVRGLRFGQIRAIRKNLKKGAGGSFRLGWKERMALFSTMITSRRKVLKRIISQNLGSSVRRGKPFDLGDVDFSRLQFPFASEVTVTTTAGEKHHYRQDIPWGAQGWPQEDNFEVVRKKFLREAAPFIKDRTEPIMKGILSLETLGDISSLVSACCST